MGGPWGQEVECWSVEGFAEEVIFEESLEISCKMASWTKGRASQVKETSQNLEAAQCVQESSSTRT